MTIDKTPSQSEDPDQIAQWHADLRENLDQIIEKLGEEKDTDAIKKMRISASYLIGQIKIGANLIDGTGDTAWLQCVTKLNLVLPDSQKIYIPPTNIPQA